MPKNDPRTSARIAWEILDGITPGRISPILRFMLAKQIANAVAAIDPIQRVAAHAISLQAFFLNMDSETIRQIAEISPELIQHITRLSFHATPNDNNKE